MTFSAFVVLLCASAFGAAKAEVNINIVVARMLMSECPDLHDNPEDVVELWHNLGIAFVEAHAGVYASPMEALRSSLAILSVFFESYHNTVIQVCPGALMRYFKKAGDLAMAIGDPLRCRFLLQWGTTYRVIAMFRWYTRITSNPSWTKEAVPPEALNFDAEYQGAYDLAMQTLYNTYGLPPRPLIAKPPPRSSDVLLLAVCLYEEPDMPALAGRNHRLYAAQHGYRYEQLTEVPEGGWDMLPGLPQEPHYWKILQTLLALESKDCPEWVMVIDCDAFVMNASISVLDVVDAYGPDANFLVAEDPAGINTGVLLFRRREWTKNFLRRVLETRYVQIWDQSQFFWQLMQEANVFNVDSKVGLPKEIAFVHQSHLNAYHSGTADSWNAYGWKPGDFVVHYAGCPWQEEPCWKKIQVDAKYIENVDSA